MERLVRIAAAALLLGACARTGVYVPTEQAVAQVQGLPAARYPVPPEQPRGDVIVSSRGIARVEPRGGGEEREMVHLAMTVSNDGDSAPWSFDARAQKLAFGPSEVTPAMVSSGNDAGPVVEVAPGQKRVIDLYFVPPAGVDLGKLESFDLVWSVATPQRRVAERTPFERRERERRPYHHPALAVGLGPGWWYDPFYAPYYAFPPHIYYGYGGRYPSYYPPPGYRGGGRPATAPPAGPSERPTPAVPSRPQMTAPAPSAAPAAPPAPPAVPSAPQQSAPAP